MSVTIRPASGGESAEITALVNAAYRGDTSRKGWTTEADLLGGQRTDERSIAEVLAFPESVLLVAGPPDGALCGWVLLQRKSGGAAHLGMLTVSPEHQNRGRGRRLLEEAEKYARSRREAVMLEMTVISRRNELIAWYERRGYRRTGEKRPFPVQEPRVGLPKVRDLEFEVLVKSLGSSDPGPSADLPTDGL